MTPQDGVGVVFLLSRTTLSGSQVRLRVAVRERRGVSRYAGGGTVEGLHADPAHGRRHRGDDVEEGGDGVVGQLPQVCRLPAVAPAARVAGVGATLPWSGGGRFHGVDGGSGERPQRRQDLLALGQVAGPTRADGEDGSRANETAVARSSGAVAGSSSWKRSTSGADDHGRDPGEHGSSPTSDFLAEVQALDPTVLVALVDRAAARGHLDGGGIIVDLGPLVFRVQDAPQST